MKLQAALELRRSLESKSALRYVVMRSGKRSLGVSPFYVAVDRKTP